MEKTKLKNKLSCLYNRHIKRVYVDSEDVRRQNNQIKELKKVGVIPLFQSENKNLYGVGFGRALKSLDYIQLLLSQDRMSLKNKFIMLAYMVFIGIMFGGSLFFIYKIVGVYL